MRNRFVPALALLFSFALGLENLGAQVPGATPEDNPTGNTGALKAQIQTGGSYDAHSGNGTRIVTDLHVPGALGAYGLDFTRYWNSLHNDFDNPNAEWPMDFGASGWSHSWRWNAVYGEENEQAEDGGEQLFITSITITFPDGHASKYKIVRSNYWHYSQTWAPDPRLGPPYLPEHGEINGWSASGSINDHLGDMAADGSNFWLYLADGGAVHFVGQWPPNTSSGHAWWDYQAKEIFDPHGLRTDLTYNQLGSLTEVRQEGDRWLTITWGTLPGFGPAIARVETGGNAVSQYVTYKYKRFPDQAGNLYVLAKVTYQDEPAPGQEVSALYNYGTCFGNETEPCFPAPYAIPLLKYADDPHYAGAMTKIGYNYSAGPRPPPPTPFNPDYFWAPLGIAVEKSGETGIPVSSFALYSFAGTRMETNGFGATRMFYFGRSAGDRGQFGYHCLGYQLAKLTDFSNAGSTSVPFEFQNYMQGQPREVWDGRGIRSELIVTPGDDSGQPGEIHHPDGSVHIYNRVDPGPSGSAARDPSRIHNPFNHWLFSQTDERNQTTTYRRDSRRRVTDITYPDLSTEHYSYNEFNQVTSHTLPSGVIHTYEYDAYHRLQREHNSVDFSISPLDYTEYTYFGPGNHPEWTDLVETMMDGWARTSGAPFTVKMTYNGRHKVMSVEYPPTGGAQHPTVTYEYDNYGNCTSIRDELGHPRTYHYDSYRRCISYTEQVDACGVTDRTWNWYYDRDFGGPEPIGASAHTSRQWRVQVEPAFNAAGDRRLSAHKFDYNDRIIEEYTGLFEAADGTWHGGPDTEVHSFTYDENGQKKKYTDPRGRDTTYEYDNRNRLWKTNETVNTIPRTTETLYDPAGNKTLVTFPDTKTQQWLDYDAFGQPGRFIDERGNTTNLSYWPWGPMKKLAEVITHRIRDDGGTEDQPTRFSYDLMGRPQTTLFPDTSSELNIYEFGQFKTWKTRRNQIKTINYDARGRESSHTWDDGTPGITRTWDDANRLLTLANSVATLDYSYDNAGQMLTEGGTIAGSDGQAQGSGVRKELSCCRYPSGEVSRLTYPNGSTVQRAYTARGQLRSVSWTGGSVSYNYLPDGKVDQQDYGNGVQTKFEYDGRGMISSVQHKKNASGPDLTYREYWRDNRDRIVAWKRGTDSSQNWMEDGRGDRYGYDEEGQLKTASYRALTPEGTPSGAKRSDSFSYDELGNRVGWNTIASRGAMLFQRRDDNGLNQYHSWENNRPPPDPHHWGSGIFYDDNITPPDPPDPQFPWIPPGNGVLMQDGYITAGFNALNQPFAMWSPAYLGTSNWVWFGYDPLGRCVKRWVGPAVDNHAPPANTNPATYYYYDGWNLVQEGPSASSADRIYVHGGRVDEIVASQAGGVWRYHHYDARGHCILLTDASGGILEQYDYDAFGQPYFYTAGGTRTTTSAYGNRFLFTGREWLSDLRIYDFRNRQYQPELGRFLQPDSKEFEAGDYNLYRYCHNDPVNKSDPTGLDVDFLLDTNNIAALGAGHAATLVGNDTTGYHFYSFGPGTSLRTNTDNMTQRSYSTHEAAMKDLSKQYEKTLSYKTDSKADAAANAEAQKHLSEDYKPVANNCGNVAAKIVGAAVPSFKAPTTFRPKDTYDANKKAADYSGPLKKEDEKGK